MEDSVAVEMDASTRAARLEMLSAAVCKLRMLFDCCECGDDETMLAIDNGRGRSFTCRLGSLWRVRMIDSFRRITPASESRVLLGCCCCRRRCCCCETGGVPVLVAREMDEFDRAGSGESEVCERLNGANTLYATGG